MSYTIRYTTQDYLGKLISHSYTEETYEEAQVTFNNVCSSLRSDFFAYCYYKFNVTLLYGEDIIDVYGLSDGDD